jgi:uncharacterized membrane protein
MTTREADGLSADMESEKAFVLVAYVLHLVGSVTALPSVAALVVNYVKRGEVAELLGTHHDWMIRTFWRAVPFVVIGWAMKFFVIGFIGWAIIGLTWIWYVYRHVLGLIRLANGDPMGGFLTHSMA